MVNVSVRSRVGIFINTDWKISLGYDHRSSGDIWEYNPGMETVKISFIKTLI